MDYRHNCFNLEGDISECRIWKSALDEKEIKEGMWECDERDDRLLACWLFDEKQEVVRDETRRGNDLVLRGDPIWSSIERAEGSS